MNQYFVESKQPLFCSFNQIIQNHETDLTFDLLIKHLEENFEKIQQQNWLKYWNEEGEKHVLQTWNEKYKYYLKEEQDFQREDQIESNKEQEAEISEIQIQETCDADIGLHDKSWEDLWHEHKEKIYCEQYVIFSTIYYNYFLDVKKYCETPLPISQDLEEIDEEREENSHYDRLQLTQDLEKLKIFGLPTSFGGRPQNSGKKHKNFKKSAIHYSDFFSDSEMESEFDESDVEDHDKSTTVVVKENVRQKSDSKVQKRKRNRKLKNVPSFILEERGLLKYWRKRFSLFSRFDEGIRLDRESWFSVTPEKVAKHLAERLKCSIIVDGFCGSGGNTIQFAFTCNKIIAIDIDPIKLEMAKHNAEIYKVSHKIEFILGDYMQLAACGKLKADIVFLSPPWGGPKYKNKNEYNIEKYLQPVNASELVETSRKVSQNIALFLPRNSSVKQIVKLAGVGNRCEIEHNYLDSRLVAITALYGEEILTKKDTT